MPDSINKVILDSLGYDMLPISSVGVCTDAGKPEEITFIFKYQLNKTVLNNDRIVKSS